MTVRVNGGALRRRLSFQSLSGTPNSVGERTQWTEYYSCWGSVDVLRGQLIFSTAEFISQSTYTITIRHPQAITFKVADHIVCEGKTFEIQSILDPEMRHKTLNFLCYVINDVG